MMTKLLLEAQKPDELLSTPHFDLRSDGTAQGDAAVSAMQAVCEQDYAIVKDIFGQLDPPPVLQPGTTSNAIFVVHVDPTAGGAYHYSCQGTEIWTLPEDAASLLVAEHVEVFQAYTRSWQCGQTNGEALSRALAQSVRPFHVLTGLDGDVQGWWSTKTDFVNNNLGSDRNQPANACGTLFLFYLRSQLGFTWKQIVQAGSTTLGNTYSSLTAKTGAQGFQDFLAALQPLDKGGVLQIPASGNPFPTQPVPTPPPTPCPPCTCQGRFAWLCRLLGCCE